MTDIVAIARSWIGTPYLHQASEKMVGCDCLGLIRGIWRDCFGAEPAEIPAYSPDWSEPQGQETLWRAAQHHLHELSTTEIQPGDIVLFRMRRDAVAKHLGVIAQSAPTPSFIHAYSGHGVVESPLSSPWRARIVARFAFFERD